MTRWRIRSLALGAVFATASLTVTALPGSAGAAPPNWSQHRVTVMTQNLYLGANLTPLFAPPPGTTFAQNAAAVLNAVVVSDFPARAVGIANEVAATQPTFIGLQEVAEWRLGSCATSPLPVLVDYQTTLLSALAAKGLHYEVVAQDSNFTATAPLGTQCASFRDRDEILARSDLIAKGQLVISNPQSAEFGDYDPLISGVPNEMPISINTGTQTISVSIKRGWTSVDATYRDKTFRFVDSHLEAYGPPGNEALFRNIQATLLAQNVIAPSTLPVIAVGDFNSRPTDTTGAYGILTSALTDAWTLVRQDSDPGNTSGQLDSLRNIPSNIDHRIDLVLFKNGPLHAIAGSGTVVGDELSDMVDPTGFPGEPTGKLWPSDHAGVVATINIGQP